VPILGIESLIYGVDDIATCTRYWEDFGLSPVAKSARESIFEVSTGSKVVVRDRRDCGVADWFDGNGVKLVIWGVDTRESLDILVAGLECDREVRRDPDGTAYALADDGIPFALRLWTKRVVVSQPDPVNAPGNIQRLNLHRKWRLRARCKTISHVVFYSQDYVGSYEFYRQRLGFRLSDHSEGIGAFARADGTNEHHSIFWLSADVPFASGKAGFMHAAFGLEDIDEVMLGANMMAERGWLGPDRHKLGGLSRHRISSAIYYYVHNPSGGEAEYTCDTDYLDDNWIPRVWNWKFGAVLWAHDRPTMFGPLEADWDVRLDPHGRSLDPFRKPIGKTSHERKVLET
jgi:catechol 2,3-dioxygenase-like lactoylglutathione lyase family enzyme